MVSKTENQENIVSIAEMKNVFVRMLPGDRNIPET